MKMMIAALAVSTACGRDPHVAAGGDAAMSSDAASEPDVPYAVWRQREPIYELYVRHFSAAGTFAGVVEKLDELRALGIGIVWLLPVNEIGSIAETDAPYGNPYAVKAYERVNPEYGSDADLRDLVAAAHRRGMHVILDWVPNHTAWDNHLITEHPEWYVHQNGQIAPVADFPWIAQLDWSRPELRAYMTSVMVDWLRRFDLDGFRIDYAHGMPLDFFAELRPALEAVKPVFLLAEAGDPAFHPAFDMTYDWDVYPILGDVAHHARTTAAIDDALYYRQLIPYANRPDALVMRMTYNHDDNGNFTLAERYGGGIKAFAVLAALLPGKPLVFDGQEVGCDIKLGHDPAVKIDWTDRDGYRPFYTRLLQLFRANPALHHAGSTDFRKLATDPGDFVYALIRRDGDNAVLAVLNLANAPVTAVLHPDANTGAIDGDYVELFDGSHATLHAGDSIALPAWGYRVYVRGPLAM